VNAIVSDDTLVLEIDPSKCNNDSKIVSKNMKALEEKVRAARSPDVALAGSMH